VNVRLVAPRAGLAVPAQARPEPRSWLDDEPGWPRARQELASIKRKALARWQRTVILAMMVSAVAVYWRWRRPSLYEGTVVMRVTEGDIDDESPRSGEPTNLRAEIEQISLSRGVLLEVMETFDLYGVTRHVNPALAVDSMRDNLRITLVQNYFAQERYTEDPMRSARVSITFQDPNPERAVHVARDLAQRVVAHQTKYREQMAGMAVEEAGGIVDQLQRAIGRARSEQATLHLSVVSLDGADAALERTRLTTLNDEVRHLEHSLKSARMEQAGLDLRRAIQAELLGTRFEIIDDGRAEQILLTHDEQLQLTAAVSVLLALMLVGFLIGALDTTVDDAADVKRLAIPVLGHVPGYQGVHASRLSMTATQERAP
jgi:hypothetical protein